ncbi:MAG: NAD-dependent epimerase/dehydratase family protein [Verrucomicrobiae bacterium]|nr:NAD-dependent epimerase/dehydratase family protein [Verrucomicrobiae bacterium]
MRILITGGAGFIGSHLARAHVNAGHEVVVADNLSSVDSLQNLQDIKQNLQFVHCDIRLQCDFAALPNGPYDRFYHLAASFANERSVDYPEIDLRSNAEGTLAVLTFARHVGCRLFVYTGSSSSYGDGNIPFCEDSRIAPGTPYALTKLLGERYVANSGIPYAIFRLFNVYGPGDPPGHYRNAIPNMLKSLDQPSRTIHVYGEKATRDFTFVHDVVEVLRNAEVAKNSVVNIGTGVETSILDLAQLISELYPGDEAHIQVTEQRHWDHVVRRIADVTRLRSMLPDACRTPLTKGIRQTAIWLHEAGHITRSIS